MSNYNTVTNKRKGTQVLNRQQLISNYLNTVRSLAIQYEIETCLELDDLISMGIISAIESIDSYDVSCNVEMDDYIYNCIKKSFDDYVLINSSNSIYDDLNQENEMKNILIDEITKDINNNCKSVEECVLEKMKLEEVKKILSCLTHEEKEILCLKYGINCEKEHTNEEISEKLNYPKQKVLVRELTAINKVKKTDSQKVKEILY